MRPEVVSDVISGTNVVQAGVDVHAKKNMVILAQTVHEIYSSKAVGCGILERFLNFDNCQPEIVSDVISDMVNQDVGMDVCLVWL